MFMMTTVLERLHTTKCSGFLGSRRMLLTVMSVPADVPRGLKVLEHSVVFMFHTCAAEDGRSPQVKPRRCVWGGGVSCLTFTVPSDEALMMWWPSGVKVASFTNEE